MLNLQTLESIKRGSRITYFNGIYAVLLGIFYIVFHSWIIRVDFSAIGSVWNVFSRYNSVLATLYLKFIILTGLLIISSGIAIIYLSSYILKKKDKTAWVVLFILGIILWPSILTIELINKNYFNAGFAFFGWLTFVIGIIIPIRYYFERDYNDY